jgi:hypothetical protein
VIWQDGILKEQGWTGTFTIERDGKTHQLRLVLFQPRYSARSLLRL